MSIMTTIKYWIRPKKGPKMLPPGSYKCKIVDVIELQHKDGSSVIFTEVEVDSDDAINR